MFYKGDVAFSNGSVIVKTRQNIEELRERIHYTFCASQKMLRENDDTDAMVYLIKFGALGQDPFTDSPLNCIEQINRSFTYLVGLCAIEYLMKCVFKEKDYTYKLNKATDGGSDIEVVDSSGNVVAVVEVFTAAKASNNQKRKNDIEKVKKEKNGCEGFAMYHEAGKDTCDCTVVDGVTVVRFTKDQLFRGFTGLVLSVK